MKYLATLILTAFILTSCAIKTTSSVSATVGNNKPKAVTAVTATTKEVNVPETAIIAAGKQTITTKCVRCHQLKHAENYTASHWINIMESMAPKARLDSTEKANVLVYVKFNSKK